MRYSRSRIFDLHASKARYELKVVLLYLCIRIQEG
jgi:hypothetical protein